MASRDTSLAALAKITGVGDKLPADAMSGQATHSVDFARAIDLSGFGETHERLRTLMRDGVLDWSRFEIADFRAHIPSLAYFDRVTVEGRVDFRYRFVGEAINAIARRPLRGLLLSDVLTGAAADQIIAEYDTAIRERACRASVGRVVVSDMSWIAYLRLLYPVCTGDAVDRLLLFMLFANDESDWVAGFPERRN